MKRFLSCVAFLSLLLASATHPIPLQAAASASSSVIGGHNSRGDTVISVQLRLRDLGYYNYKITGQYGRVTEEAVAAFQKENNLHPDGRVGAETMEVLFSNYAKRTLYNARKALITPTPTPTPTPKPTPKPTAKKTSSPKNTKATATQKKKATATPKPEKTTSKATSTKKGSSDDTEATKTAKATKTPKPEATSKPRTTPKPEETKSETVYVAPKEAAPGYGRMAEWSEINRSWGRGETVVVKDLWTGIQYRMYRQGGSNHVDAEPASKEDNDAFLLTYNGKWSWDRRPVLVKVNGEWIAGSTNGYPHGKDTVGSNGMSGQICIHFLNSRTHTRNAVDKDHQSCIRKAAGQ